MINAARSRIRNIGGSPNGAAARVLFELMSEEDSYNTEPEEEFEDVFEALIVAQTEPYMGL